jgi:hypothetical protein
MIMNRHKEGNYVTKGSRKQVKKKIKLKKKGKGKIRTKKNVKHKTNNGARESEMQ